MKLYLRRRILLQSISVFFCVAFQANAALVPPDLAMKTSKPIRVRLARALEHARVRGFDLRFLEEQTGQDRQIAAHSSQAVEWEMSCKRGRVIAVNARTRARFNLKSPVTVETPAGFLQFQGHPYRSQLQIYADRSTCEVVNSLDLEKYLDGLVNAEFSAKWSEESVAAQVVAARTYALYQIRDAHSRKNSRFDVESTVSDQVYNGAHLEDFRASRSVERTRGMVLMASTGKIDGKKETLVPLKAFYHSTCGGSTDLPERVWGGKFPGFKHTVRCPYCALSPVYRWDLHLTSEELSSAFSKISRKDWPKDAKRWFSHGKLLGIRVSRADPQGRAVELNARWSMGNQTAEFKLSSTQFRSGVGVGRLRSTWFGIRPIHQKGKTVYELAGRGFGHGVGLCQWGAKVMGEKGFKMASILKFYYPDAQLKKLW